jgi:hypothetical protein
MSRIRLLVAALLAVLASPILAPAQATRPKAAAKKDEPRNYLANPGAEKGRADQADAWGAIVVPPDGKHRGTRAAQAQAAHSGKASLAGEVAGGDGFVQWVQQVKDVPRDTPLRLSGYIKSEGDVEAHIMIQAFGPDSGPPLAITGTEPLKGRHDWTLSRSDAITIPRDAKSVIVRLVLSGKGKAWFDDIALTEDKP